MAKYRYQKASYEGYPKVGEEGTLIWGSGKIFEGKETPDYRVIELMDQYGSDCIQICGQTMQHNSMNSRVYKSGGGYTEWTRTPWERRREGSSSRRHTYTDYAAADNQGGRRKEQRRQAQ